MLPSSRQPRGQAMRWCIQQRSIRQLGYDECYIGRMASSGRERIDATTNAKMNPQFAQWELGRILTIGLLQPQPPTP